MDEGPQQRQVLKDSERGGVMLRSDESPWPQDLRGVPAIKISVAASELVPTIQYGNLTVGPVVVTQFVQDLNDDDDLLAKINRVQTVVEKAVAEDRQSVHVLMRSRVERKPA